MKKHREELLAIIDRFTDVPLLVVGDLIVDHYIWGKVDRISPEAPVVVVQVTEEDYRPGGAGNVVRNLATLGAKVAVCGVVGEDNPGRLLREMLGELGADTSGVVTDPSRQSTLKSRVIAHAQQVVRVDRESTAPLEEVQSAALASAVGERAKSAKGVIVSDYGKGAISASIFAQLAAVGGEGFFGGGKVPLVVDPKAAGFGLYHGVTVVKPNRKEAEEASGLPVRDRASAIEAGRVLLNKWNTEMVLITLGELGMVLVSDDNREPVEIKTVAREVFDVSGAGDTVSAVFTLALAVGASPRNAAELANFAAGIVVGEVGTVTVTKEQLCRAVEEECDA
jgi:D-beta-D-heptose 7-phosphate kinase/D-beta-D-heptose 1-phosphate adenosyltransferase